MKTSLFVFMLFISFSRLSAQIYYVTKIQGVIYYNNLLLKKGDSINNPSKLMAERQNAYIRLLNPEMGSIPIGFASGKKVMKNSNKHSELYEIFVQRYITEYTSTKSMKTRGPTIPFDWYDFFNSFASDHENRRILIIENQKIPLISSSFSTPQAFSLFICTYQEKDSIMSHLPVKNDSINFPISSFPVHRNFKCKLKMKIPNKLKNYELVDITNHPIESNLFTIKELVKTIEYFRLDWSVYYKNQDEAKTDFYNYLKYNYGKYYKPEIEIYVNRIFGSSN